MASEALYKFRKLVVLLVALFLVVNLIAAAGGGYGMEEAVRAKCLEVGIPAEDLHLGSRTIDNGTFGFGGHASLVYAFGKPPQTIRVELRRSIAVFGWEATSVERLP